MHRSHEKGTTVKRTERSTQKPSSRTGLLATLRIFLGADGSGAPFVLVLTLLVSFAITAAPALAESAHVFSTSFGGPGSGAEQVSLVSGTGREALDSGVAVDAETGDVYVADTDNHRVDEFESNGTFVRAWGWGVADGLSKEAQTCTVSCVAGFSGSGPGEFETPTFIAVDNSAGESRGDVYVGDPGDGLVSKFTSAGALVESWGVKGQLDGSTATDGPFGHFAGLAVDASGDLWVWSGEPHYDMFEFGQSGGFIQDWRGLGSNSGGLAVDGSGYLYFANGYLNGGVVKFSSGGVEQGLAGTQPVVFSSGVAPTGLAADLGTDDLYVDEGGSLIQRIARSCIPVEKPGCPPAESFGSPQLSGGAGLAVDSTDHAVYAADATADRVDVFTVAIEATVGSASEVKTRTATVSGDINPKGEALKEGLEGCRFEYGLSESYGKVAPCAESSGEIGSGGSPVTVHAALTALEPETVYHYRVVAANRVIVRSEDGVFTTLPVPRVDAASAVNVSATSADLTAQIDPKGADTHYRFEYGTSTAYGTDVPVPDGDLGAGGADVSVSQGLTGLSANTEYHWRVVASNANGTVESPDHAFVYDTGGGGLPDGRAYEMVTPPAKNAALIAAAFEGDPPQFAEDGSRFVSMSIQCFASSGSCNAARQKEGEPYAFTRTPSGWVTTPLAPAASRFAENTPFAFSANTGLALFSVPTPPAGEDDWYLRELDGSFVDIGPATSPSLGVHGVEYTGSGVDLETSDFSHVVYEASPVWPSLDGGSNASSVYEYVGTGNAQPVLVGVSGGSGSTSLISRCGTHVHYGALSEDGGTVYFTAVRCGTGTGANLGVAVPANQLYARIDQSRTVHISAPEPACDAACHAAPASDGAFEGASADGSRVFFTDTQQLTDGAGEDVTSGDTAEEGQGCSRTVGRGGCNLYLYDLTAAEGDRLIDVSAGDSSGLGPRVQGVLGVSSDGSHVYFVAKGVLTAAPNSQGQGAEVGADNLYVYERDASYPEGRMAFIAVLPEADKGVDRWMESPHFANVTPDGRFLVFESEGHLTVDDTASTTQIFRYDAQTGELVRISIGEHGFDDNGNEGTGNATIVSAGRSLPAPDPMRWDPTMSDDGEYVFFESPVGLTAQALDDVPISGGGFAVNVYEYHDGQVFLISDGRDTSTVNSGVSSVQLWGSDATGANVLFTTADQLVARDTDTQLDFYDARICTSGDPCVAEPPPGLPPCLGEACHGTPAATPSLLSPVSMTFNGVGNLTPGEVKPVVGARSLTSAQKLAGALRACRRMRAKHRRVVCEKRARRRYSAARGGGR